jgi:hypothetical protein
MAWNEPVALFLEADTTSPEGKATRRPLSFQVELAPRQGGRPVLLQFPGTGQEEHVFEALVPASGTVDVVVRAVTDQGVSAEARTTVTLPAAPGSTRRDGPS